VLAVGEPNLDRFGKCAIDLREHLEALAVEAGLWREGVAEVKEDDVFDVDRSLSCVDEGGTAECTALWYRELEGRDIRAGLRGDDVAGLRGERRLGGEGEPGEGSRGSLRRGQLQECSTFDY
jgi:hypothetical protein